MSTRSTSLKKMERLYGLIENMHALTLQQAAVLVHEAEAAIALQIAGMREARADARAAILEGDHEEYAVAEVQRVAGGQRHEQLEALRQAREAVEDQARTVYETSRIERGQIKTVVDRAVAAERLIEVRRMQAVSDDRFLSRLRWNQLHDQTA